MPVYLGIDATVVAAAIYPSHWLRNFVEGASEVSSHYGHHDRSRYLRTCMDSGGVRRWTEAVVFRNRRARVFRFTKFWEKNIVIIREKWSVGIMINKEWLEPRLA
jgi:hypothetical protein